MTSDYEAITLDNIRRRGEEFDDIGEWIAEQFYSDRTHFIYELLQNAEDALYRRKEAEPNCAFSKKVVFQLFEDRLELRHYGYPFNEDDVIGISDILKGTKKLDYKQIGKFGIGFKSVYAFTASPEIHSGDEHFCIERYIRPQGVTEKNNNPGETLFIFPFDHHSVTPEEAFEKIYHRFSDLGLQTLIFLTHIDQIVWEVNGSKEGLYMRDTQQIKPKRSRRVYLVGEKDGDSDEEDWLIFEKEVFRPDGLSVTKVEVAYRLEKDTKTEKDRIAGIDQSPLFVYFPTDKETHLRFLIQGHYKTTPARDNVSVEDSWNLKLIDETADLVGESLIELREMDLITFNLLQAMPIRPQEFPKDGLFRPFFNKVRGSFLEQSLLPTYESGFASAKKVKLARSSELRQLLSDEVMHDLYGSVENWTWLTEEITLDRTPDLRSYLMQELDVEEIDPEKFAGKITVEFLENRTDEWMARFYAFLDGQKSLWRDGTYSSRPGILRNKPIIRLEDGTHVSAFDDTGKAQAYLSPEEGTEFPAVKKSIASNREALSFLNNLGLKEPDIVDEIVQKILPKYQGSKLVQIDQSENIKDVAKIIKGYTISYGKRKRTLTLSLNTSKFLQVINASTSNRRFQIPSHIYNDQPDLRMYFEGNPKIWFLDYIYYQYKSELCSLGVRRKVEISSGNTNYDGHVILENYHGYHKRGLNGFDPEAQIDGLEFAVQNPTLEKSTYIWNKLLISNSNLIRGIIQTSGRRDFARIDQKEEAISIMGHILCNNAWLPDEDGVFHNPQELTLEDLPSEYIKDETLAMQLQMKTSSIGLLANDIGIDENTLRKIITVIKERQEDALNALQELIGVKELTQSEEEKNEDVDFSYSEELEKTFTHPRDSKNDEQGIYIPAPPVVDVDFRRKRTMETIIDDIYAEPEKVKRFKKVPVRVWDDKNYEVRVFLNEQYNGYCQICHSTFIKRNGEPYFEGLYLVSKTKKKWIDRPGNVICLCANCCAKFQHGPVEADDIIDQISSHRTLVEDGRGVPVIKLKLCDEDTEIRFSERHMLDLQEMIKASQILSDN